MWRAESASTVWAPDALTVHAVPAKDAWSVFLAVKARGPPSMCHALPANDAHHHFFMPSLLIMRILLVS